MISIFNFLAVTTCKIVIFQRTENEWDRLSADCVGASSVRMFKKNLHIPKNGRVYLDR